ncbi:MAG: 4-hydroxythreonine-4-phosphate dehydrogenase PdxA [Myxococcales bacterium]|nr:4-hydroxythreonine-4-phosphate dehydrogenase PdxA [Myxococcales bacterium]
MTLPLRIGITLGDPSGIGPEVCALALADPALRDACLPIVFGDGPLFARTCARLGVPDRLSRVHVTAHHPIRDIHTPSLVQVGALDLSSEAIPGHPSDAGGLVQFAWLERAVDALVLGELDALCTAPISKERIHRHRPDFQGHTEYLAARFGLGQDRVLMLLAGPTLRVAIHTRHLAIADVPGALSIDGIGRDLDLLSAEVQRFSRPGRATPRIAVLALNPHAGEGGLFGDEEGRVISPAIERARARGLDVHGPFAADGFFAREVRAPQFDAVLAMFHDQGLIPLKMAHFDDGVNVTVGLPKPRASPDHGVAYDIAGKGLARAQSMKAALRYLIQRLA